MRIRVGYELIYRCPLPTPMILMLNIHFSRASDVIIPDHLIMPRMGRVLIARGRDAADVAIATTFGPNTLESFTVWTDEVTAGAPVGPVGVWR